MPVKGLLQLSFVAALLASGTAPAQTAERSMLGDFDLKSAVLSPAPLGPPSQFVPPAAADKPVLAARPDAKRTIVAKPDAKPDARPSVAASQAPRKTASSRPRQKSTVAARKPKASPLESYARDVRRQTWPCTGGGICAWSKPQ